MSFRASFCDPLQPDVIELGDIITESIVPAFEKIPWAQLLAKMETASDDEIYYSPSLEIENKLTMHGLSVSAIGDADNYSFGIFYKRPKKIKTLFGLKEKLDQGYLTDIMDQSKEDVIACLNALQRGDLYYLEKKIGK